MYNREGKFRYIVQISTDPAETARQRRKRKWYSATVSGKTARQVNRDARDRLGSPFYPDVVTELSQVVQSVRVIGRQGSWRGVVYEAIVHAPGARPRVLIDKIK